MMRNGLLGLDNMGNTCYMNAALQALSNCYALSSYFLECAPYVSHLITLKHHHTTDSSSSQLNASISYNYMRLIRELWQGRKYTVNKSGAIVGAHQSFTPNELVHSVKLNNPMFRGYMQHDSQEFLIYLMDQLHEELKRPVNVVRRRQRRSTRSSMPNQETETRYINADQKLFIKIEKKSGNFSKKNATKNTWFFGGFRYFDGTTRSKHSSASSSKSPRNRIQCELPINILTFSRRLLIYLKKVTKVGLLFF